MTAYRVDEFEEEYEDFDIDSTEAEHRSIGDVDLPEDSSSEDIPRIAEVVAPKTVESKKGNNVLEVTKETITFKTKCQLMREEMETGNVTTFYRIDLN